MYSANFDYHRPKTVAEAVTMLRKNKGAKVLAGGHSLIPMLKIRTAAPGALIDIGRIKTLNGVKATKTALKIGATTTHNAVATSREIKKLCPALAEAAAMIGDQQVRDAMEFSQEMHRYQPGDTVTFSIVRQGKSLQLPVLLEEEPS